MYLTTTNGRQMSIGKSLKRACGFPGLVQAKGTLMGHIKHRKGWLAGSLGIAAVGMAAMLVVAGSGASATAGTRPAVVHARPGGLGRHGGSPLTPVSPTAFSQQFATNTGTFCAASPPNALCDGNSPNDYGTIDRVSSKFNNGGYGNYAPETPAAHGSWLAVVSGSGDGNQGVGCPGTTPTSNPGETCSGPYALFDGGTDSYFPTGGFTVTDDLYLSPTTAGPAGSLVDDDVALNTSTDGFGIDNVITACYETGGFVINYGNGSPGSCTGPVSVTADGWYRFVFDFQDVGGSAYVTESVVTEANTPVVISTSSPQPVGGTVTPVGNWGGPLYFWLPSEDFSGLPLANFALQLGSHPNGHTP